MQIHLVGAGGVGFWLAAALARSHVEFTVYDTDNFVGGLGWSRVPKASNPETKKVQLLKGFCLAVMGDKAPKVIAERFTGAECVTGDLVIDCSDMDLTVRR